MAVMGAVIPITLFQQFQDAFELLVTFSQHRVEGLGQFGLLPDALTFCCFGSCLGISHNRGDRECAMTSLDQLLCFVAGWGRLANCLQPLTFD